MGKGDKKTRRGKIYRGSHGKVRPHSVKPHGKEEAPAKGAPRKTTRRRKAG